MTDENTDEATKGEESGPDFNDPTTRAAMVEAYAVTHGFDPKKLSQRAKDLIIERLEVIHQARVLHDAVAKVSPIPLPPPAGQLEYMTFMFDKAFPAFSIDRLTWDLEFAKQQLEWAANLAATYEEASRPRLHIPGVGETAHINNTKG